MKAGAREWVHTRVGWHHCGSNLAGKSRGSSWFRGIAANMAGSKLRFYIHKQKSDC